MGAATAWFVSVVAVLGLVLGLYHLGVNATGVLGTLLRSWVHLLGEPLVIL
jgi:hypothetical protein